MCVSQLYCDMYINLYFLKLSILNIVPSFLNYFYLSFPSIVIFKFVSFFSLQVGGDVTFHIWENTVKPG